MEPEKGSRLASGEGLSATRRAWFGDGQLNFGTQVSFAGLEK